MTDSVEAPTNDPAEILDDLTVMAVGHAQLRGEDAWSTRTLRAARAEIVRLRESLAAARAVPATPTEPTEAADLSSWMREGPHRLAVDGKGYVWRVYLDDTWSMAPVNPDNSPVPQPIRFYVSVDDLGGDFQIAAVAAIAKGDHARAEAFQVAADFVREWGPFPVRAVAALEGAE